MTYFAERSGPLLKEDPDVLIEDIIRIYREWDENTVTENTEAFRRGIEPFFERDTAAKSFQYIYERVLSENS